MVVAAALSAERLPSPSTRAPRVSMALSLALHALALVPLLLAGASGGASVEEPALIVEFSFAAPAAVAEASAAPEVPSLESVVESAEAPPPPGVPPLETPLELAKPVEQAKPVELPNPEEPPPLDMADLKPVEPPKPAPPPPPPPPKPKPASTAQAAPAKAPAAKPGAAAAPASAAPAGAAQGPQQAAAAPAPLPIVFEGRPRFRTQPKPAVYPPHAIELGQQGEALVRVRLEPDGSAAEILLWRGTGFDQLDRAALAAVRGWQFLPAVRDGRAVAAWVEIPIRFHLR